MRAVVIGSGPNGLAGAVTLARAGLDVEVLEEQETFGGGTRSLELTLPGYVHDVCSAIHPLGAQSPFFKPLGLDVEWVHSPIVAAHPLDDGSAVVLHRSLDETARGLGRDGDAYRRLVEPLVENWDAVEPVLVGPFPTPAQALGSLVAALGPAAAQRSARAALADARSLAESVFETERARAFFAGMAAHSILPMERRPTAGFALALLVLGHVGGWGFPRGGAQRIPDALVAELERLGGTARAGTRADALPEADVALADVSPRELLRLGSGRFGGRYERALRRYRHGPGVFKLDWALREPVPWRAPECNDAATVHLGGTLAEISASEWAPWTGRIAEQPFVLLAQQSRFDPTRGEHTLWAYCHVPHDSSVDMTERIEAQIERYAPGFRDIILARSALGPAAMEAKNRNLVGGDINVGAMDLGQLFTRPVRRPNPYRTPLRGVYICSSATPPGGGVHGMCGLGAARTALVDLARWRR